MLALAGCTAGSDTVPGVGGGGEARREKALILRQVDGAGAAASRREEAMARADAAADTLMRGLMARLQTAMEEDGPTAAIRVCSQVAQSMTREIGDANALAIRRTALRTRNPRNAPDAFERSWLARADAALAAGESAAPLYEVGPAPAGGEELRMLRPIVFPGGICSQCHGGETEIAPEVRELLRRLYPADQAVGFRPGDLRGAVSVRVPLD